MKRFIMAIALVLVITATVQAQYQVFIVQKGSNAAYYQTLNSALEAAEAGSDIILPAGTVYYNTGTPVDRELHIYGVGHHPLSTAATGKTILVGQDNQPTKFWFWRGSSNSSISGVEADEIQINGSGDGNAAPPSNILINRCKMNLFKTEYGYPGCIPTSITVRECVVGTVDGAGATQVILENNVITGTVYSLNYATLDHNIFASEYPAFLFTSDCVIKNNIFTSQTALGVDGYSVQNVFENNLCAFPQNSYAPYFSINNIHRNNGYDVGASNLFVTYDPTNQGFSYGYDFHLKTTGPAATFVTTDNTEVGIYGGSAPWKDGSAPIIPRITNSQLGTQLVNGNLNVNISVEAQTR